MTKFSHHLSPPESCKLQNTAALISVYYWHLKFAFHAVRIAFFTASATVVVTISIVILLYQLCLNYKIVKLKDLIRRVPIIYCMF